MASTICGWCGDRTHMEMVLDPYMLPEATWPRRRPEEPVWMAAFRCSSENCERLSIGWSILHQVRDIRTAKFRLATVSPAWEPVSIRRPPFADVPEEIAATASEAHSCLSIGAARGAVALARAVVEATAKAKGITVNGIVGKIDALRDAQIISALTADASHQIRRDGNSIAHGDIGDEAITQDDAEAILDFMDSLLDEVFQRPAKLDRLRRRHDERKQGAASSQQMPPEPSGSSA